MPYPITACVSSVSLLHQLTVCWIHLLALQEERIKLDKDKFDFEQDLEKERIMNVDMSTMSTKQQLFYADLQEKILARRLEN
jgi:hypothetical protein